jgi:hypothetical protein
MAVRKRALKPDPQGRYRPYLGYRIDGKQQRFNIWARTKPPPTKARIHVVNGDESVMVEIPKP